MQNGRVKFSYLYFEQGLHFSSHGMGEIFLPVNAGVEWEKEDLVGLKALSSG